MQVDHIGHKIILKKIGRTPRGKPKKFCLSAIAPALQIEYLTEVDPKDRSFLKGTPLRLVHIKKTASVSGGIFSSFLHVRLPLHNHFNKSIRFVSVYEPACRR